MPESAGTSLSVSRSTVEDVQDRVVNLWLDDEVWGPLRYGRTITREITPGRHRLKGHNTLSGVTVEFEASPGDHVRYRCINAIGGGGMVLLVFLGVPILRVRLEREE